MRRIGDELVSVILAGNGSTNSRGHRPLPEGALYAVTITEASRGAIESTRFFYDDNRTEMKDLISWTIGQHGCLWGFGGWPFEIFAGYDVGIQGSYGNYHEFTLADALGDVFDGLLTSNDMSVRFFQSGGEACAAAARIARHATGRASIASYGYHGAGAEWAHRDASGNYPNGQMPQAVNAHMRFEFGDVRDIQTASRYAACLMVEVPPVTDEEARAFLQACRKACDDNGIPLIIDDVVTGFRVALGGATELYGVKPDIVILGKAMSARGKVAAVLGRRDMVDLLCGTVFYSTTFGGAPDSCAIATATIKWLKQHEREVYGFSGHLDIVGQALKDGLNELGVKAIGQPSRSVAVFPTESERRAWCSRMIENGILVDRPFFSTLAHTMGDVDKTLVAARRVAGK